MTVERTLPLLQMKCTMYTLLRSQRYTVIYDPGALMYDQGAYTPINV